MLDDIGLPYSLQLIICMFIFAFFVLFLFPFFNNSDAEIKDKFTFGSYLSVSYLASVVTIAIIWWVLIVSRIPNSRYFFLGLQMSLYVLPFILAFYPFALLDLDTESMSSWTNFMPMFIGGGIGSAIVPSAVACLTLRWTEGTGQWNLYNLADEDVGLALYFFIFIANTFCAFIALLYAWLFAKLFIFSAAFK